MNKNHISFTELSDYIDQELDSDHTKKIKNHLGKCEYCQESYNKLLKTINLLATFKNQKYNNLDSIIDNVYRKYYLKRKKITSLRKILWPVSAAAIFLIFFLTGMLNVKVFDKNNNNYFAGDKKSELENIKNVHREYFLPGKDIKEVVEIMKQSGADVLYVSENEVIGEAKYSDYRHLRYQDIVFDESIHFNANQSLQMVSSNPSKQSVTTSEKKEGGERIVRFKIKIK